MAAEHTAVLKVYEELTVAPNVNLTEIVALGRRLGEAGFSEQAAHCFDISLDAMHGLIKDGHLDAALWAETLVYEAFVKLVELEGHYKSCFDRWVSEFSLAAESLNLPVPTAGQPNRICFFLHSGYFLGHTAVLLKVIEDWQLSQVESPEIYVAILTTADPKFIDALSIRGVQIIRPDNASPGKSIMLAKAVISVRQQIQRHSIGKIVWVSVPTVSSFALNLPMAHKQIFWSLKFHPVHYRSVDLHICGGHMSENTREYHERVWTVCPFPLTVTESKASEKSVEKARAALGEWDLILGCMAREEKFNSRDYLSAVAQVLKSNPQCKFIYTGRKDSEHIRLVAEQNGVTQQIEFVGWVDTDLYAGVIDIFLETFPFGCGVTSFQSMAKGTPIVSYCADDTMFGYQLQGAISSKALANMSLRDFESLPILTAQNVEHYVDIINRLIKDNAWRREIGKRQQQYYRNEMEMSSLYSAKLLQHILD